MDKPEATMKPAGLYAVTYYKGSYEAIVDFYEVFMRKLRSKGLSYVVMPMKNTYLMY
ncbi:hypothetical protein JTT01_13540 [Clostridium botulinum]|nr:hypothetical protein [Clostridium botulinum]